jgi:Asp-tRNA(Asn)/Glu-tRNA(Gln) amidotransferase A subunit family amidase
VVEERPPNQAEVREVFEGIALAEIISLLWPLIEPREDEVSPQIRRLLKRRETLDVDLATYAGQLAHRLDLERAANAWLETNHIAVCPISATAAFPIGTEMLEIEGQEYEEIDLFSMSTYVNAMSLPAVAVPVGRTPDGLPIGVQVIGRRYRELEVLAVARELEQALGGWIKPENPAIAQA